MNQIELFMLGLVLDIKALFLLQNFLPFYNLKNMIYKNNSFTIILSPFEAFSIKIDMILARYFFKILVNKNIASTI